jgi:hypothetical protein
VWKSLRRWPLLLVGCILIGGAITLSQSDPDREFLLGSGCLILGAGLAEIIHGDDED